MQRQADIIVPASTSNLGASFDTCGLALGLYLRVRVEPGGSNFEIVPAGEGAERLPRDESNLIARVARFVASKRERKLDGATLHIHNEIPLARGLGSSSAAIIAGISVYEALTGDHLNQQEIFSYALHFEAHGDNLAPSLLGGLVVACVVGVGEAQSIAAIKRSWPDEIKVVIVVPELELETEKMRAALPREVPMTDAIFNVQRAALLQAAIDGQRYDLLSECLRDRLHQPFRGALAPSMQAAIALNDETAAHPGLLGVAVSGAGSSIAAFATGGCEQIGAVIVDRFTANGVRSGWMVLPVDDHGRRVYQSI